MTTVGAIEKSDTIVSGPVYVYIPSVTAIFGFNFLTLFQNIKDQNLQFLSSFLFFSSPLEWNGGFTSG